MASDSMPRVPAPWTLKGDVYFLPLWQPKPSSTAQSHSQTPATAKTTKTPSAPLETSPDGLPLHAYSPLESGSSYATTPLSRPVGGFGAIQIVRYTESPVGPYDELIVLPGNFAWRREDADGNVVKKGVNPKISRIYVSQKETCYNGRVNWNVPKHLARFDWDTHPDGSTTVRVYPHDTASPEDPAEPAPSPTPFFQATLSPFRYAPAFPFSSTWAHTFGVDTTLVLPPLPHGQGSQGELPGTDRWCAVLPRMTSRRTMLSWFDMQQQQTPGKGSGSNDEGGRAETAKQQDTAQVNQYGNFWPGLPRWRMGIKMEDAVIEFAEPETWEDAPRPRASL